MPNFSRRVVASCLTAVAILTLSPCIILAQSRVHVITVADTLSADIGKFAETSSNRVANQLQLQSPPDLLKVTRLSGEEFSRRTVLKAIRDLPTKPDDAILYYYVGHGFYDKGTLFAPPADNRKYFYLREIHEALRKKEVRLIVSVSDCCSQRPTGSVGAPAPDDPTRPQSFTPLLEELFLRSSGEYSINSSKPGEYAICGSLASGSGDALSEMSVFSAAWMSVAYSEQRRRLRWKDFVLKVRAETISNFDTLKDPSTQRIKLGNGGYLNQDTQTIWANYNNKVLVPF